MVLCVNWHTFFVLFTDPTPPKVEPYNGDVTIEEGTEKVIKCIAKASPKSTAAWYRNGKKLNTTRCSPADQNSCQDVIYENYEENPDTPEHTTFTTQTLKIRSASYPRDQGEFKCVATNGYDPPGTLIIDLDVQGMYM